MRKFNGPQDWYKYLSGLVIRELNEVCPEKCGQVMREFLGVKWPRNTRDFRTMTLSKVIK